MRAAVHSLTLRGRAFLAAGLSALACAVLLGQRDLARAGVLLVALPLVSAAATARAQCLLSCRRHVEPGRMPAGTTGEVLVEVENLSRLVSGVRLQDAVPAPLGRSPRFVLDRFEHGARRYLTYPLHPGTRGRYQLGPLRLTVSDPFGMCELTRTLSATDSLIVTPPHEPLPALHLGGDWAGDANSPARAVAAAGEDDVATREYRHGDELRRVHWPATARRGELMVRREERPWQSRASVLVDSRAGAHLGAGAASSFEFAVSAAASIGVHLIRRRYAVRLLDAEGARHAMTAWESTGASAAAEGWLLDELAVIETSPRPDLDPALHLLRRGGGDGLVVVVAGSLDSDTVSDLARARHGSTTALAVLLDTDSWAGRDGTALARSHADVLSSTGWRVAVASRTDQLGALWARLGGRTARVGPTPVAGAGPLP